MVKGRSKRIWTPVLIFVLILVFFIIFFRYFFRKTRSLQIHTPSPTVEVLSLDKFFYGKDDCHYYNNGNFQSAISNPDDVCQLLLFDSDFYPDIPKFSSFPVVIETFKNLRVLSIRDMDLSEFPKEILVLEKLERFDLSANDITVIPDGIYRLKNLRWLVMSSSKPGGQYIRGNYLTKLPETFGNLKNLEYLNLNENGITSLPDSFWNLTNLRHLDLEGNRISNLDSKIGNLINMQALNLAENDLTMIPEEIGRLENLIDFNLAAYSLDSSNTRKAYPNRISQLPTSLGGLINLESLNLSNLPISSLPQGLTNLRKLKKLDLINTEISRDEVEQLRINLPKADISFF